MGRRSQSLVDYFEVRKRVGVCLFVVSQGQTASLELCAALKSLEALVLLTSILGELPLRSGLVVKNVCYVSQSVPLSNSRVLTGFLALVFQAIPGVPRIKNGQNPATWMLEVTSISAEAQLGMDFTEIHENSALYQ